MSDASRVLVAIRVRVPAKRAFTAFTELPVELVETRVTVEHFGWDGIPSEGAARHGFPLQAFRLRFAEWWQHQLHCYATTAS